MCWRTKEGSRKRKPGGLLRRRDEQLRAPRSNGAGAQNPRGSDEPAVRDAREARREVRDRGAARDPGANRQVPRRAGEQAAGVRRVQRENHDPTALSRSRAARDGTRERRPRDGNPDRRPTGAVRTGGTQEARERSPHPVRRDLPRTWRGEPESELQSGPGQREPRGRNEDGPKRRPSRLPS